MRLVLAVTASSLLPFALGLSLGTALSWVLARRRLPTPLLLRQAELASLARDSPSALAWLSILARRRPRDAELHAERAWHLARVGRAREAASAYRRAVRLGQRDAETLLGLARALEAAGHREEAGRALAEAIALDPTIEEDP